MNIVSGKLSSRTSHRVDLELVVGRRIHLRYAHLRASGHLSPAAFSRLFLPDAIPESFSRVIYLDSDLLVRSDLSQVWRMDMLGTPFLAVRDYSTPLVSSKATGLLYKKLGINRESAYLNSGFLVMDLKVLGEPMAMRRRSFVILLKMRTKSSMAIQDGINAVMAGTWGELDPLWNVQLYISINNTIRIIEESNHKERLVLDRWRLNT